MVVVVVVVQIFCCCKGMMATKIMRSLGCGAAVVVAGLALVADVAQAQSSSTPFAVPPGVTISSGGVSVHIFGFVCWCWCCGFCCSSIGSLVCGSSCVGTNSYLIRCMLVSMIHRVRWEEICIDSTGRLEKWVVLL